MSLCSYVSLFPINYKLKLSKKEKQDSKLLVNISAFKQKCN
jgi:hypothetical protein